MKKLLLATAVAALTATAANAAPTVYGKAFLLMQYVEDGDITLDSKSSRIGFKGAEALSDDTSVVYKLEYGINVDADKAKTTTISGTKISNNDVFSQRDTYLGLSSKTAGTVLAGRLTTIDDMVNYANVAQGIFDGVGSYWDGGRANNALAYVSPSMGGVQFLAMYGMTDAKNGTEAAKGKEGLKGTYGVGGKYESDMFNAGVTYIAAKSGGNKAFDYVRLSGSANLTPEFTVGALFDLTDFEAKNTEKEKAVVVSGTYDVANSPVSVWGQAEMLTDAGGVKGADTNEYSLGMKYKMAKATTGHAFVGMADPDGGDSTWGIGAGIEHKF